MASAMRPGRSRSSTPSPPAARRRDPPADARRRAGCSIAPSRSPSSSTPVRATPASSRSTASTSTRPRPSRRLARSTRRSMRARRRKRRCSARHGVRFVVADAPPLGCAAAATAGIPSVVVSNFTWDWIYADYREYLAGAPDLIPAIQAAYSLADAAWRLPMHGGFETFEFAARRFRQTRADRRPVRRAARDARAGRDARAAGAAARPEARPPLVRRLRRAGHRPGRAGS